MTTLNELTGAAWIRDVNKRLLQLERLPRTRGSTLDRSSTDISTVFEAKAIESSGEYTQPTLSSETFGSEASIGGDDGTLDPYFHEEYDEPAPSGYTDLNYSPVTPSAPITESRTGGVAVTWDGLGAGGEAMPVNLLQVDIHRSVEGPEFEPDDTTYGGSLLTAGTWVFTDQTYDVPWYYRLVTLTRDGLRSTPSAAVVGIAVKVAPSDVGFSASDIDFNNVIADAAAAAAAAQATADAVQAEVDALEIDLGDLTIDLSALEGDVADAVAAAAAAQTTADNAQTTANAAQAAATAAQADADAVEIEVDAIPAQIETARLNAIATAAADATSKADLAEADAIAAAAADATNKAELARVLAIAASTLRTNLSVAPRATASWLSNGATWTVTNNVAVPAAHPLGITTSSRATLTAANGVLGSWYNVDGLMNSATSRGLGVWVYSPVAGTAIVYLNGNQGATQKNTPIAANTWTYVTSAAASTGYAILQITRTGAGAIGDSVYATGSISEAGRLPADFFDGNYAPANFTSAWTGSPLTSSSQMWPMIADNAITATKIAAGAVVAGKIATDAVTANTVAAGAILARHLFVGDTNNYATIDADPVGASYGGMTYAGGLTGVDGKNDWVHRASGTPITDFMFRRYAGPVPVKAGDRVRLTFDGYVGTGSAAITAHLFATGGSVAGTIQVNFTAVVGAPTTMTTSVQSFTYEATIPSTITDHTSFLIGINSASFTTNAPRVRDVRAYRMGAGELIVDGAILASKIGADQILAVHIKAGEITAAKLAAGTITAASGVIGSIDASVITTGTMDAARITAGTITGAQIAAGTITSGKIGAGEILTANLGAGQVTAIKIATGTITAASGVIGSLDAATITTGTLDTNRIAAGTIAAVHLAAGAVTAGSISAGAIDGLLITGATIRTAATGERIMIDGASQNLIQFITDDATLQAQAYIRNGNTAGGGITTSDLELRGPKRGLLQAGASIRLADKVLSLESGSSTGGKIEIGDYAKIPQAFGRAGQLAGSCGGTFAVGAVANGASTSVNVTFPAGSDFFSAPAVTVTPGSARLGCAVTAVSTTGFTVGFDNWSGGNAAASTARYTAVAV